MNIYICLSFCIKRSFSYLSNMPILQHRRIDPATCYQSEVRYIEQYIREHLMLLPINITSWDRPSYVLHDLRSLSTSSDHLRKSYSDKKHLLDGIRCFMRRFGWILPNSFVWYCVVTKSIWAHGGFLPAWSHHHRPCHFRWGTIRGWLLMLQSGPPSPWRLRSCFILPAFFGKLGLSGPRLSTCWMGRLRQLFWLSLVPLLLISNTCFFKVTQRMLLRVFALLSWLFFLLARCFPGRSLRLYPPCYIFDSEVRSLLPFEDFSSL